MHPIPDASEPGYSQAEAKAQIEKQAETSNALHEKYRAELAHEYDISEDQLRAILVEGIQKNWPMP